MLILYLILINAAAIILMLVDKKKAKRNKWRIPESTLLSIAVLGGSVGILLGMHLFRHKTKHTKFTMGVPIILSLQIVAAVILLSI